MIYYSGYSGNSAHEQLLPDGQEQLVIELDGNPRKLLSSQGVIHLEEAWITGIQNTPLCYFSEQNATTLCIQFNKGGLYSFLGIPAEEFKDLVLPVNELKGLGIPQLREQLLEANSTEAVFCIAQNYLLARSQKRKDTELFDFALKELQESESSLAQIAKKTGCSQKSLIAVFKKLVGISPKKYQRLHRFNQSLALLNEHPRLNFSQLALSCYYYDQAHFIQEFKHFSGYTPGRYLNMQRDYPHVLSISSIG